mmetsp:Transcript_75710/g.225718  ORF Transcript_75710/g.225718 Transcript_75710/m.225718 type:complete len:216 (-) Transcript_75710:86-733(-)
MGAAHGSCGGCTGRTEAHPEFFILEVLPALDNSAYCGDATLKEQEQRIRCLILELFQLHDLDGDGALQERELISINEQIAVLHHGDDVDLRRVRQKYRELFRDYLDPDGKPVSCEAFCDYTRKVLDGLDHSLEAQEMILEQWSAEARTCRELFPHGEPLRRAHPPGFSKGSGTAACKPLRADSDLDVQSTADESPTDAGSSEADATETTDDEVRA